MLYYDEAKSLDLTADGGFFIAGHNAQLTTVASQALAMKLDAAGKIVWAKGYDEGLLASAVGRQMKNGGYFICGATAPQSGTGRDAFLIVLSPSGKILRQKCYFTRDKYPSFRFDQAEETSDGGHIACGTLPISDSEAKGLIVKLSPNGKIVLQKTLSYKTPGRSTKYLVINDIHQSSDGRYICSGWLSSGSERFAFVCEFRGSGALVWKRSYSLSGTAGKTEGLSSNKIVPAQDGGYYLVGLCNIDRPWDAFCAKLSPSGQVQWARRFQHNPCYDVRIYDVHATSDGGCLVAGSLMTSDCAWLAKISAAGDVRMQAAYQLNDEATVLKGARELPDGRYAFSGRSRTDVFYVNKKPVKSYAVLAMTTDTAGLTCAGVEPAPYTTTVDAVELKLGIPNIALSPGVAKERKSRFKTNVLALQEQSWGTGTTSLFRSGARTPGGFGAGPVFDLRRIFLGR